MSCIIRRILVFKHPIVFTELKLFSDSGEDVTESFAYSWSVDGICWTGWTTYENYLRLAKHIEGDFYLKILVVGLLSSVMVGGCKCTDYTITLETTTYGPVLCDDDESTFLVYSNLDCALLLQQQLADTIICMLGIPAYYFRVEPIPESEDYTFKEFTLHNIVGVRQLKLMLNDGELPSSNPHLSDFEFDWEVDWDVEVSKTHFANAFGDTAVPKQRDIIYVPLMKRLWVVNSAYDEKKDGLMWRSTTFKLALRKYEINTNFVPSNFDALVDNLIISKEDELFTIPAENEQERLSGFSQVHEPSTAQNNTSDIFISDGVRKSITENLLEIKSEIICQKHGVVARNFYVFQEGGSIIYSKGYCGHSGQLSFIFRVPPSVNLLEEGISTKILNVGPMSLYFTKNSGLWIGDGDISCEVSPSNTYLLIYRWNKKTYTREMEVFVHTHRTDIPSYRLSPEQYYFDTDTPICSETIDYNLDYEVAEDKKQQINLTGYPLLITNLRWYNKPLGDNYIKESLKYTTTHEDCVFNDVARPFTSGRGMNVR